MPTSTLKVTGSKSVNISYSESGGEEGAGLLNTGYDRHESLRLNLLGQIHERVKIQGNFSQSDLSEEEEYDLTLTAGRWEAFFGNFGAFLPESQYLSSGMSSTGVKIRSLYDHWNVAALYGTPRGRTVYEKFYGDNTQGPYTVSGAPLVSGTETVWLNKVKLTRGVDYEFDSLIGRLTFKDRVVGVTELVEVQVQSRSAQYDTQVYGYRFGGKTGGEGRPQWSFGQGYLRQHEEPDPGVTTLTGRAATDTHLLALDAGLERGPSLKAGLEGAYSFLESVDEGRLPSRRGGAYRAQVDTFQGPFHAGGAYARTEPRFNSIGNPLASNDYREWKALCDYKPGDAFFASADRNAQRTRASGGVDDTVTDHGECRVSPSGWPVAEYNYYRLVEDREDAVQPLNQESMRHGASLSFGLPGKMTLKTGGEQEMRSGDRIQDMRSRGGRAELASNGWARFNFACSGVWKSNDVLEANANTTFAQDTPRNGIPSQNYNLTMEGRPLNRLTLTGKGSYSSDPPGPPRALTAGSYQTDLLRWLASNGSYSLEFQQKQVLGAQSSMRVHTGSGTVEITPMSWFRLSAQPSFRLEWLPDHQRATSENTRQAFTTSLNPAFISVGADLSDDRFSTWDYTVADFPLNFRQSTKTQNINGSKVLGDKVSVNGGYRRSDQKQTSFGTSGDTSKRTLTQNVNDGVTWNISSKWALSAGHTYNQLNQDSPGQGIVENPLLPYGPDTFNAGYSTNDLNIFTKAHTYSGRSTEQLARNLSVYQEVGYTRTRDVLRAGSTETYSPAAGYSWKPLDILDWSGGYQFNASRGQVSTQVQKVNTTLAATLNQGTNLALNWAWSKAIRPDVFSQQGNISFTTSF